MDESSEIEFLTIEYADSDLLIHLDEAQREQPGDSTYRDQKALSLRVVDRKSVV